MSDRKIGVVRGSCRDTQQGSAPGTVVLTSFTFSQVSGEKHTLSSSPHRLKRKKRENNEQCPAKTMFFFCLSLLMMLIQTLSTLGYFELTRCSITYTGRHSGALCGSWTCGKSWPVRAFPLDSGMNGAGQEFGFGLWWRSETLVCFGCDFLHLFGCLWASGRHREAMTVNSEECCWLNSTEEIVFCHLSFLSPRLLLRQVHYFTFVRLSVFATTTWHSYMTE